MRITMLEQGSRRGGVMHWAVAAGLACAMSASPGTLAGPAAAGRPKHVRLAAVPAGETLTLHDTAIVFDELDLEDQSVIQFDPSLHAVNLVCLKLVLNGQATIQLTPAVGTLGPPPDQRGQDQAHADAGSPHDGAGGAVGLTGAPGTAGTSLDLTIGALPAPSGSLWIETDGTDGGPGGRGGDGGKGSSGPRTGVHNPNGGNGGRGGDGGAGGRGGDTASVRLTVGGKTISATQAAGVAPSPRPDAAGINGTLVISGAPGKGGTGGPPGQGGPGGEGHEGHLPASNSRSGNGGPSGSTGPGGLPGKFVP